MNRGEIDFEIRPLAQADHSEWRRLWHGYLVFYKTDLPDSVTAKTWTRLLDLSEPMHGLVAASRQGLLGIVHYIYHRSTWSEGDYCYLQDLYTGEGARGSGIGRGLIEAVYETARADGASRVYWLTHETNAAARILYDKVAARSGFIQYRKLF